MTWPRPRTARTCAGRRQHDVRCGPVALGLGAGRLEPGDPGGRAPTGHAPVQVRSSAASRGPALNVSMPDDRPEDLADLLGRERVAQDVVGERVADRGHDRSPGRATGRQSRDRRRVSTLTVSRKPHVAVDAGKSRASVGEVRQHRVGRPAQREERRVRRHDAVRVRRRRRVGLRVAARAAGEAVVDERVVLVGRVAVGVHADRVDAVDAVAALGDVRRREAPVAVAGLDEPVVDLRARPSAGG